MVNWFGIGQKNRGVSQPPTSLDDLDFNYLPILSSAQLQNLLGLHNRIRTIRRLAGIEPSHFDAAYQCALDRFIESAQLQPASSADHHASAGGLIMHTLEVIEISLQSRKQYMLPQNTSPERIADEEHAWTYAVFAGTWTIDVPGHLMEIVCGILAQSIIISNF